MKSVMRKKSLNVKGFTLIEIIASLVILVIVGALVIISTIRITQGFVFTKKNAETSQKGHIALNRLTKEFTNIISVSSGSQTAINFTRTSSSMNGNDVTQNISWTGISGDPLRLDGQKLVDNVNDFSLTYYDDYVNLTPTLGTSWDEDTSKEIEITLSLVGANGNVPTFTARVVPRNLEEN